VKNLARMGDLFINDAFGTAHRSQPTIVGLPEVLPAIAGLLMEREVENLSRVFSGAPRPVTFILGGTKVDDSIDVARHVLTNGIADNVLAVGVVANIFLAAKGYSIGKPSMDLIEQLGYNGQIEIAKDILSRFGEKIVVPEHVAIKKAYQDQMFFMTDRLRVFQDIAFGGAWPLVVRGLTCLALIQLTSEIIANYLLQPGFRYEVLIGTPCDFSRWKRVAITGP